jgi:uncharacterized protein (TIGR02594 family)
MADNFIPQLQLLSTSIYPLVVFLGMLAALLSVIFIFGGALRLALSHLSPQAPAVPVPPVKLQPVPEPDKPPAPPHPVQPVPKPADPAKPAPPLMTGPFAAAPPWFQLGLHDIGFHETGNNLGIERFIAQAHTGALGDPWCAIWANAKLEEAGIRGTRSASSQSFRSDPGYIQIPTPVLGCLAVFWRGSQGSGLGHVGFYRGEDAAHVWVLGGNESDMVQIEPLPKASAAFGLEGYWWPKSVPVPSGGPVIMPPGSGSTKTDPTGGVAPAPLPAGAPSQRQTGITATVFGGSKDPNKSAYDGHVITDTEMGVGLPFHFRKATGGPRMVRVIGPGGTVEAPTVDVGPWNDDPGDPYWDRGTRPQAESGTDMKGRHTNLAGIDLTPALAHAVGIDGKGKVDWEFVTAQPTAPAVT